MHSSTLLATLTFVLFAAVLCGAPAADGVRVYEAERELLTGPYDKSTVPARRREQFVVRRYPAVFIENRYVKCCVLPTLGGRLYEVYHKPSKSQVFHVGKYIETSDASHVDGHLWDLGGIEINFPYFVQGNTYNDVWTWAKCHAADGWRGIALGHTARPSLQRTVFRVFLREDSARVRLEYRFENLNPYPWGVVARVHPMLSGSFDSSSILRDSRSLVVFDARSNRGVVRVPSFGQPWGLQFGGVLARRGSVARGDSYTELTLTNATPSGSIPRQSELGVVAAAESWYGIWEIGGCVFADERLALNVKRARRRLIEVGICAVERLGRCAIRVVQRNEVLFHGTANLDPALPWTKEVRAASGDATVSVVSPNGELLANYTLGEETGRSTSETPSSPRRAKADALSMARDAEILQPLELPSGDVLDDVIEEYSRISKKRKSVGVTLDLARARLKQHQLRGPRAEGIALASAETLLRDVLKRGRKNSRARFYLGLAVERQHDFAKAAGWYNDALNGGFASPASGVYLARIVGGDKPREGVTAARRSVEACPESARARQMLILALIRAGEVREALQVGDDLYAVDPADPITAWLMADAWSRLKSDGEEAAFFRGEAERLAKGNESEVEADLGWLRGDDVELGGRNKGSSVKRGRKSRRRAAKGAR